MSCRYLSFKRCRSPAPDPRQLLLAQTVGGDKIIGSRNPSFLKEMMGLRTVFYIKEFKGKLEELAGRGL